MDVSDSGPIFVIVMGVSGSGKTTLATGIAQRMGWQFREGDELHPPANVEKMSRGEALTDEDRWPWLEAIGQWLDEQAARGESAVVTCSALRRTYRDLLRQGRPGVSLHGIRRPARGGAPSMTLMVDRSLYAAFLVAALALCVTPGPDMMFIVAVGGRGGPLTGVTAAFGVACAMFVHTVAAALGLSALFLALPTLYHVLRWAGAAYLLYLAVRAFCGDDGSVDDEAAPQQGRRRAFWRGAVTNLLNPKVILFNVSFLPQFVNPELGHVREQFLLLGCTITAMGLLVDGSVGLLSGKLAALLRRSRRVARGLDCFSGTVFAGLAVRLAAAAK